MPSRGCWLTGSIQIDGLESVVFEYDDYVGGSRLLAVGYIELSVPDDQ